MPSRQRETLLADLEREWTSGDENYHTEVADWSWATQRQARGPRRDRTWRVIFTGRRRRIEVRRPLMDADGHLVVPNLNEEEHYGRSPAWGWE